MKKENQKLAKVRKAQQKKQQAQAAKMKKICTFVIPGVLLLALIIWAAISGVEPKVTYTLKTDATLQVKDGDTINLDYVGYIDGVEFEGGSTKGQGTYLTIGSKTYIDDFEEQLIGSHPGDEVEVNVTFPENYGKEELNGKDAKFVVKVNGIYFVEE